MNKLPRMQDSATQNCCRKILISWCEHWALCNSLS